MRHDPLVFPVVDTDVFQAIDKRRAAAKEVLEIAGHARIQSVPLTVDDPGCGEHEGGQAKKLEILPHLVRDANRLGSELIQSFQVNVGHGRQRVAIQPGC